MNHILPITQVFKIQQQLKMSSTLIPPYPRSFSGLAAVPLPVVSLG